MTTNADDPFARLQLEPQSTVQRAADELRRAVLAGEISPGTPLREVALSDAMGIGRSTVREALGQLVADGLAVRVAHKGVAVKALSPEDVADVGRARVALELAGVRRWPQASTDERAAVRAAYDAYRALAAQTHDPAVLTKAHLMIHRALVGLTGSERLLAAADSYNTELRLGLAHLDRIRDNVTEQVAEHGTLVDLLEAGAVEAAVVELEEHLAGAEQSLADAVAHGTISP